MNIPIKDLVAGKYYKGWDAPAPNGRKIFMFVERMDPAGGGYVSIVGWKYLRKVSIQSWTRFGPVSVAPDKPSNMKLEVSRSGNTDAVTTEGVPLCPADPQATPQKAIPVSAPLPNKDKAWDEKQKLNEGKTVIPENKNSKVCIKCGSPNKEVALACFSTFYCPKCERT